jgi:hypothetical protein
MSVNSEDSNTTIPQSDNTIEKGLSNEKGLLAYALTFVTSFLDKPWQAAIPFISLHNRTRVIAYALLFLGFMLPSVSLFGESASLLPDIEGFFGWVFILSALVAAVTFGLGLSSSVPRNASRIVLGMILFLIIKGTWDIVSSLLDLMELCGSDCGSLFKMAFSNSGMGETLIDSIDIGFYLFVASFIMLFPCAFSKKTRVNHELVVKLQEINALKTASVEYTDQDINNMAGTFKSSSKQLFNTGVNKLKETDLKSLKKSASQKLDNVSKNSDEKPMQQNPMIKKVIIGVAVVLVILLVLPSGPNSPDKDAAEIAYKQSSDYQQAASVAALMGGSNAMSMKVNSIENCEEYKFEDGDLGVACDVDMTVKALGNTEKNVERSLFFEYASEGWQYHGAI